MTDASVVQQKNRLKQQIRLAKKNLLMFLDFALGYKTPSKKAFQEAGRSSSSDSDFKPQKPALPSARLSESLSSA